MARRVVRRQHLRRDSGGFTLIELLVVIGLLGILAAIALASFAGYRQRAHDARAMHDLGNAIAAEEANYTSTYTYATIAEVVGPATIKVPGLVISGQVRLSVEADTDRFVVRATSLLGTGVTYEYDSTTGVIIQR
jgi:type IV pilus assembly protein PilA